jgi:hypothetical protein
MVTAGPSTGNDARAHRRLRFRGFLGSARAPDSEDFRSAQVAALLNDPRGDVVVALWRDPDASKGVGVWVAKGLPVLEAIIERGSIATLPTVAFWLRDHEHALAIEAKVAGSTH